MKKRIFAIIISILLLVSFIPANSFAALNGSAGEAWDVFKPSSSIDVGGYRYGPSSIINADGSIDMWMSSPGLDGAWDYIRYKHSADGGKTWGEEITVLMPTKGAYDAYSCCDPGVIKLGDYYYIGYTSTLTNGGTNNSICIARSKYPDREFEKWNGTGWGGDTVAPFIVYDGPVDCYGAGEPSFVEKDGTLYIYYTWSSRDGSGNAISDTRVATVSKGIDGNWSENWPKDITFPANNTVLVRGDGEDSADIKYVDAYNKFIAVTTKKRLTENSFINIWESTDGLKFTPANMPAANIKTYCHNCGISGTTNGHFAIAQNNFIAYAYGSSWGSWYLAMSPFTLTNDDFPAIPELYNVVQGDGQVTLKYETISGCKYKIHYTTQSGIPGSTIDCNDDADGEYTVTGLVNGTRYYFSVSSSNDKGESNGSSAEISAIPMKYSTNPAFVVNRIEKGMKVDGDISGFAGMLDRGISVKSGDTNNAAKYGALWDNKYLYFAFDVTDASVINSKAVDPQNDDSIEIYLDGDPVKSSYNDHTVKYLFRYGDENYYRNNISKTDNVLYGTSKTENGYTLEVAIP